MRKKSRPSARISYCKQQTLNRPAQVHLYNNESSTCVHHTTPNPPSSQLPEHLFHRLGFSFYKLLVEAISLHCLPIETLSDGS